MRVLPVKVVENQPISSFDIRSTCSRSRLARCDSLSRHLWPLDSFRRLHDYMLLPALPGASAYGRSVRHYIHSHGLEVHGLENPPGHLPITLDLIRKKKERTHKKTVVHNSSCTNGIR